MYIDKNRTGAVSHLPSFMLSYMYNNVFHVVATRNNNS